MEVQTRRPLLIYDGECRFCCVWIKRWRRPLDGRVDLAPSETARLDHPTIPEEKFEQSVVLIESDGSVHFGADATLRAIGRVPGWAWLRRAYAAVPSFAQASELGYRLVAANRGAASRLTRWLVGADIYPESQLLMRRVFLGLLGAVYLCAFVSLWVQVEGLMASNGILPAARYLELVTEQLGAAAYVRVPTLLWLSGQDPVLHALCASGALLSVLLIAGVAPRLSALGLWVAYLSLVSAADVFFSFQWDMLLLETGLLAIFLAPPTLRPRAAHSAPVSRGAVWLLRWLLFRVHFLSGMRKWLSGDEAWTTLRALDIHYFTQPLPTWTAYYVHHLPAAVHTVSVAATLMIEVGAAFLVFGPRQVRRVGCALLVSLQLLILATGNYGFFNLLTIALCITLLDDRALRGLVPARLRARLPSFAEGAPPSGRPPARTRGPRRLAFAIVAVLVIAITGQRVLDSVGLGGSGAILRPLVDAAAPFRSLNGYGLFAVMTKSRDEIIVEGSDDGVSWQLYEFKWKPGPVDRAPAFTTPHMPRLDWQMWFAALRDCTRVRWMHAFLERLLQGRPEVAALLERNPFPSRPPRFLRTTRFRYEFSDLGSPDWWQRRRLGPYCPMVTLHEGRLAAVNR